MQSAKVIVITCFCILLSQNSLALRYGEKGRVTGPAIHTTYFTTPNNGTIPVQAYLLAGTFINSSCHANTTFDAGQTLMMTGDRIDLDAFRLKSMIGGGYSCIMIFYLHAQRTSETIRLFFDGVNYIGSYPTTAEVQII